MRVAIVRREPAVSFSMDVYADGLIDGLRAVRPHWEVVSLQPQTGQHANAIVRGIKKYHYRYWKYPKLARSQSVDLVHVIDHSDGHIAYWFKNSPRPVVVTCHDLINFAHPENIGDQARLAFVSTQAWRYAVRGLRHADHIVAVSGYTAKDINRLLGIADHQITVVPDAVETGFQPITAEQRMETRQRYQIPPEAYCLLNVGSNHPRKNISTLLQVLRSLHAADAPAYLLKVGADFTAEQKAFIQQQQLSPWIIYAGKPDKLELIKLYGTADVLVAPSLYEGFGMTLLEAMACGTPVVTSNTSSLPEAAGDAALFAAPTDVEAIANAIKSIRTDTTVKETLISRGLERVQNFTWQNTAERVARVYENILHFGKEGAV